jgi:two-component system response regulator
LQKISILNKVIVAHDGVEALHYLYAQVSSDKKINPLPQLILLDLKLPKLSGYNVLKRIRANSLTQLIPVVIMTSSSEENDITSCYHLGANSYVCKPVKYTAFTKTVEQLGLYWLGVNQSPPQN